MIIGDGRHCVFYANGDSIPDITIDSKQLKIVAMRYYWRTRDEEVGSGRNLLIVAGYLEGDMELRCFYVDYKDRSILEATGEHHETVLNLLKG